MNIRQSTAILKDTFYGFSRDNVMTLSAALAYYTVFSLPAILLIIIYVAGVVFGRAAVSGQIQNALSSVVGASVAGQLQAAVRNASVSHGGTLATAFGVAALVFSATSTFVQLQQSLNMIWGVKRDESAVRSFAGKRLASFLVIVGVSILVLASLGAGWFVSASARLTGLPALGWLMWVIEIVVFLVVFTVFFALIFKLLPDVRIEWSDVWAGAIVTSVLFMIGKSLIEIYLGHSTTGSIYGAAGSLTLLLLWSYYSAIILLTGAEFVQAWSNEHGRRLEPEPGAVFVGSYQHS